MRQEEIEKLLDYADMKIEKLDEQYITNGRLNPIINVLSDKPVEIMGEQVVNFSCNDTEYIVFEQTGLCIKKKITKENKSQLVIKRYKEHKKEVYIVSLIKGKASIELRVNKDGIIEIKKVDFSTAEYRGESLLPEFLLAILTLAGLLALAIGVIINLPRLFG